MRIVFFGTPAFAVPSLERLLNSPHPIVGVVTQPDRPRGRGQRVSESPVKALALTRGLPLAQPDRLRDPAFLATLKAWLPDLGVVVAYGREIPEEVLALPAHGLINVHASLLPKYRGAAPIQWAIASGEKVTGVTTMRIDAGLDTGDILLQREMPIGEDDTSLTVAPPLAELGAELLVETLHGLEAGTVKPTPQDHSRHTLAPILKKEDGMVDFTRRAQVIYNRFRGFQPWPGAFTGFRGKQITLHSMKPGNTPGGAVMAGEIVIAGEKLLVACGEGSSLEVLELQLEGKKRMAARDFINGYRPKPGERFEPVAVAKQV